MKKGYVTLATVKKFLKEGGRREDIIEFMGYDHPTVVNKWISRRRIPRWARKGLTNFFQHYHAKRIENMKLEIQKYEEKKASELTS